MHTHPRLDEIVPINFFSSPQFDDLPNRGSENCLHIGYLVKDGKGGKDYPNQQRIRCSKCGKRFRGNLKMAEFLNYQLNIRELVYELFFAHCRQEEMAERWGMPQSKLSQFKRNFVDTLFKQHPLLGLTPDAPLPLGVLHADETYMGKKGNSNTEVVITNLNFEVMAAGPARKGDLQSSITGIFDSLPEQTQKRLRILVSDGEPSYTTQARLANGRVIHVQQIHAKDRLGEVFLNKYEKFGPHYLHYRIKTHWKIFKKESHEISVDWEIKFIKTPLKQGRGRPQKNSENEKLYHQWRQKKHEYESDTFQKKGSASLYINKETKKVSMRKGAHRWIASIFQHILPLFLDKCITNNQAESKNSQVKRNGASRKQPDAEYANRLFRLSNHIAEVGKLPPMTMAGRPLFKYVIKSQEYKQNGYELFENGKKMVQRILIG